MKIRSSALGLVVGRSLVVALADSHGQSSSWLTIILANQPRVIILAIAIMLERLQNQFGVPHPNLHLKITNSWIVVSLGGWDWF